MRRRNDSQAVISWFIIHFASHIIGNMGITGSGKSSSLRFFLNLFHRPSAYSKKELKLTERIKVLETALVSFGNANASRHGRYLELHFIERGRVSAAHFGSQ